MDLEAGFSTGLWQRPRIRQVMAGKLGRLSEEIARAKQRFQQVDGRRHTFGRTAQGELPNAPALCPSGKGCRGWDILTPSPISSYQGKLTDEEVANLLSYLLSLKGYDRDTTTTGGVTHL